MPLSLREKNDGLIFKIHVQPRSSRNKVTGAYDDALKVMLTAPPVDNAANKACCTFFAKELKVKKSSVSIVSGQTGRSKQIFVKCRQGSEERNSIRNTILEWAGGKD
jgi:uncharacterized protein (TIGR00251 family)